MSELYDRSSERRGFPGGLRAQLLLGLLLLVIGTVALVAIVVVEVAERQIRQTEIDRAIGVADHLAALHRADTPGQRLQSFRRRAGLSYAELSIDGRRFTSGTLPRGSEGRRPTGPSETHRIVSVEGQSYVLAMVRRSQDGHRVTARVARSLEEARERVERAWRLLWVYLALDALFVVVVGYGFLTFLVVRPIRAIGVATRRAARGDLASHIELLPSNEFGEVGRSFNAMLDELRENRRELEERLEELDRAYTELEQTQESLIRSEKLASVGQLAAGVAHEIGNPLSAISGYLEVLRDSDLDEQQREEILERAESQLDRIQAIIRDLLDYSREEADAPVQAVSLHAAVEDAIALVEPQPRARSLEIEECLPDEL
ncbi:MAG: sensor histidine kinase, partial [Bradymonadaceae bacterium]